MQLPASCVSSTFLIYANSSCSQSSCSQPVSDLPTVRLPIPCLSALVHHGPCRAPSASVRVKFGLGGTTYSFIVIAGHLDWRVACGGFEGLRCLRKARWQIARSRRYPFQSLVVINWSPWLPRTCRVLSARGVIPCYVSASSRSILASFWRFWMVAVVGELPRKLLGIRFGSPRSRLPEAAGEGIP